MRRYDAAKYAVVSSEGRAFEQVTGELTRKLLMYIGGSNEPGEFIRNKRSFHLNSSTDEGSGAETHIIIIIYWTLVKNKGFVYCYLINDGFIWTLCAGTKRLVRKHLAST